MSHANTNTETWSILISKTVTGYVTTQDIDLP